jgi:hypothetical protein
MPIIKPGQNPEPQPLPINDLKGGKNITTMEFQKIEPGVFKPQKEGETVEGTLRSVEESKKYKEGGKIYHLETKEGAQIVVFGTTVLDDRMSYIQVGDFCKIIFKGSQPNKKGQPTKIFEVYKGKA